MQPLQSSGSFCKCSGTSSSLTISEITARPPVLSTRKISSKSCRFERASTRFRTQFETTTSIESFAINGLFTRSSCASSSAARNDAASLIGRRFNSASSKSTSNPRSWIRPLRNSTFEYPTRSATIGAFVRAIPSISSVMSTPMTLPEGPTTCAAMKQIFPVPLPRSKTVSPSRRYLVGSPHP